MERRAKAAGRVSRDVLLDAPLPQATKTYTVISHKFVIDTIKDKLATKGFVVTDEVYSATDNAQIAYGIFRINYGNDPELGMLFAFNNSYNKQLKFSCAVGAYVKTNEASILSKDGAAWIRMHTGTADQEAEETIEEQIDNATVYFQQLMDDKNSMLDIKISRREYGELLGRLFVDAKLLGMEQVSLAKKEYEKPSFNYISEPDSLWTAYNHILVSLAKSHPRTWMEQQKLVHYHMMTEFDFTVFDDEEDDDPNQLSLPGLIATLEDVEIGNTSDSPDEIPTQDELDEGVLPEAVAETLSEDDIEEAEDIIEEVEMPVTRLMTKKEIVEEYGDILPAEKLKALGIDVKPELEEEKSKPTISMKDAIEKYGNLITDNQAEALLKGERDEESINTLKSAYLADQEKKAEEAFLQEGAAVMTKGEPTAHVESDEAYAKRVAEIEGEPIVDLDAEEDADWDKLKLKKVPHTLNQKEPTILGADSAEEEAKVRQVLEESELAVPTSMKEVGMEEQQEALYNVVVNQVEDVLKKEYVESATDSEAQLPQAPVQEQAKIETPAEESVEESVSDEVDVPDFFMTKTDIVALCPDLDLEVGLVVSIGDEDCEILSISPEDDGEVGLSTLTMDEPIDLEPTVEEIVSEIEDTQAPAAEELSFDIGEPDNLPPAETMLRTQSSDVKDFDEIKEEEMDEEQAAEIEKAMEIMNSKVELSPAEQAIRDAIETEVVDLYGAEQPFTYKLSGDQYNIALESGETFILTAEYIDSIKEPV